MLYSGYINMDYIQFFPLSGSVLSRRQHEALRLDRVGGEGQGAGSLVSENQAKKLVEEDPSLISSILQL